MPARTAYTIPAGAGFVDIPATIPAHKMTAQMTDPAIQITYKSVRDAFANAQNSALQDGYKVTILGHGTMGILGRHAGMFGGAGAPGADVILKISTTAQAGGTCIVEEFEGPGLEQ